MSDGTSLQVSTAGSLEASPKFSRPWLKPRFRAVNTEFGYDEIETGCEIVGRPAEADLTGALAEIDGILAHAPIEAAGRELARLNLLTKSRDQPGAMTAYLEELRRYPEWAINEACQHWRENEKFFPAWSELRELLERRVGRFKRIRDKLEAELRRERGMEISVRRA